MRGEEEDRTYGFRIKHGFCKVWDSFTCQLEQSGGVEDRGSVSKDVAQHIYARQKGRLVLFVRGEHVAKDQCSPVTEEKSAALSICTRSTLLTVSFKRSKCRTRKSCPSSFVDPVDEAERSVVDADFEGGRGEEIWEAAVRSDC